MIHFERLKAPLNSRKVFVDHNLFEILVSSHRLSLAISAQLNCTVFGIFREIGGRVSLGQGALKTEGIDIEKFLVVNPRKISTIQLKALNTVFERFARRELTESVFEEIGALSRKGVSLDKIRPDRRALDKLVMGDILGLTDEEQLEVYRAVVDLVKSRIDIANSVERKKKTKDGIDIDAFVKTVMGRVGGRTLGKFFKEKILSHKPLASRNLPKPSGEIKIESDFEGYRLYYGKKYLLCDTQSEARYLKVWMQAGLESIKVPKDKAYLARIVPSLEKLLQKIKETIESHTDSILQPKLRQKILHQIWQRLTEGVG